jgi:CTP synthase
VPLELHAGGLDEVVARALKIETSEPDLAGWQAMVDKMAAATEPVKVGIVGKYVDLPDAYLSVVEALRHGATANDANVEIVWIAAEDVDGLLADSYLEDLDAILVPGGFGIRGVEGKIRSIRYARDHDVPFLGLCLGLQCAVIEYARSELALANAHSSEFDPTTKHAVIDLMADQRDVEDKGGTMRLGVYPAKLREGSMARELYGEALIYERHRHRFEVANRYRDELEAAGLVASGVSPDDHLVEIVEAPGHRFFIASQFHPELKSRPDGPHPLFVGFIAAALERRQETDTVPNVPDKAAIEPFSE